MPILMGIFMLCAISQAPWWSITDSSISRLAGTIGDKPYWSATGTPAIIMNLGFLLCGTLSVVFGIGLWKSDVFHNGIGKLGKTLYVSAGIMLFGVGVFPLTVGDAHYIVSYSLFVLAPVSIFLMGVSAIQSGRGADHNLGYLFVIMAFSGAIPFVINWPWQGIAIPEILAIVPQAMFSVIVGYELMVG
jgi:hypothetical membrane protein